MLLIGRGALVSRKTFGLVYLNPKHNINRDVHEGLHKYICSDATKKVLVGPRVEPIR